MFFRLSIKLLTTYPHTLFLSNGIDHPPTCLDKGCLPKKKLLRRRHWSIREGGGKKNPLFLAHQKGDIFLWGEGSNFFCPMSHVHFCVSVSTQFVHFCIIILYFGKFSKNNIERIESTLNHS